MEKLDLLIRGATVLTMDPGRRVIPNGVVGVAADRIVLVGEADAGLVAEQEVDGSGCWLIPGLVQGHVHLCQALFRNQAEGLPLLPWLEQHIWPMEAAHDEASLAASARLGMAEMLLGGTTAALDMGSVRHTETIFEVAAAAGFRLTSGKCHMDAGTGLPAELREDTHTSMEEAQALCRRYHEAEGGRLRYAFAPRFVLSCSDELLQAVGEVARSLGARLHTHCSENLEEGRAVEERFGAGNPEVLQRFGLTAPDVALAHCVWVDEKERSMLAETGAHVIHCPSANLKLGSGLAPVPELLEAGVNVALGADGAPCNNNMDAFQEMRLAGLLQKPRCGAAAMPAEQVLEMATLGGARAMGLEDQIGSIETGKRADLVLVQARRPHLVPAGADPYSDLVFSSRAADVCQVWVDGVQLVDQGALVNLDSESLVHEAEEEGRKLLERAY